MEDGSPIPPGLLGAWRALGDGLLASLESHVELVSVELHEEKFRLIQTFMWISAAVFAGMMAVTFGSLTLVYLFWESARVAVLGGLTLAYTAALGAILFAFRRYRAHQPGPFAATLQEIGEDRACIRNRS
jgi:uncharacterized membrane protein YqjE